MSAPTESISEEKIVKSPEERKVLLIWRANNRPFKKRNRDFFTTIAAIVFLLCVISAITKEWMLALAIIALTFLVYVLNSVPPEEVEHSISNKGIITGGTEYQWKDLIAFFFSERYGQKLLNIDTKKRFMSRLLILIKAEDEKKIKDILGQYLEFKDKPDKNFVDDAATWLGNKIPLEK